MFTIATNDVSASVFKQRHERFRKLVEGTSVVIKDGDVNERLLHGSRMVDEDFTAAARDKGAKNLDEVSLANDLWGRKFLAIRLAAE